LSHNGYQVDPETHQIDYDLCQAKGETGYNLKWSSPGAKCIPEKIDFAKFREISTTKSEAYLLVDMAHIAGLVAAGLHMNPVPYADFVTTTYP